MFKDKFPNFCTDPNKDYRISYNGFSGIDMTLVTDNLSAKVQAISINLSECQGLANKRNISGVLIFYDTPQVAELAKVLATKQCEITFKSYDENFERMATMKLTDIYVSDDIVPEQHLAYKAESITTWKREELENG